MSPARKPVIVRLLGQSPQRQLEHELNRPEAPRWYAGYADFHCGEKGPDMELLDLDGKLLRIEWNRIKWVCYVRELTRSHGFGFPSASTHENDGPERLLRRHFAVRPRMPGVWLRLTLADGEELEGIAANDRTLLEGTGLLLTPPDTRSNTQRIFLPRTSIREATILAIIPPKSPATGKPAIAQPQLFDSESS